MDRRVTAVEVRPVTMPVETRQCRTPGCETPLVRIGRFGVYPAGDDVRLAYEHGRIVVICPACRARNRFNVPDRAA